MLDATQNAATQNAAAGGADYSLDPNATVQDKVKNLYHFVRAVLEGKDGDALGAEA